MKTIPVLEQNVINAFKKANVQEKGLLANLFGRDFFSQKITDRIKTFEDACEAVGENHQEFMEKVKGLTVDEVNYKKVKIIAQALNEEWKPDWSDRNQRKYFPWFEANSSGGGFSYCGYAYWLAYTRVGSRLCYKSAELAEYAGKQFINEYNGFLN